MCTNSFDQRVGNSRYIRSMMGSLDLRKLSVLKRSSGSDFGNDLFEKGLLPTLELALFRRLDLTLD